MKDDIRAGLIASAEVKHTILENGSVDIIEDIANGIIECLNSGGKVMIAGNGGSAADAQHISAEFTGRYLKNRRALPAIALTCDTSAITAIGNDFGFDNIFSRQIEGIGAPGDVFLAISTSGNSTNLIEAINMAKTKGLLVVAFLGKDGGEMKGMADIEFIAPSDDTPRIQEAHITVAHLVCGAVENEMVKK